MFCTILLLGFCYKILDTKYKMSFNKLDYYFNAQIFLISATDTGVSNGFDSSSKRLLLGTGTKIFFRWLWWGF